MMPIRQWRVGTSAGHTRQGPRPVDAYVLDNGNGLAIEVWTYGATLVEVRVPDRRGRIDNVVLRYPDLASYERRRGSAGNPWVGATQGRFCRIVAQGRFRLDDVEHQLERNDGINHIHGGTYGFDRLVWEAEPRESADELAVHLRLTSPDGDEGYPGTLSAETIYRVHTDNRLTFEHRAVTTKSTIVGLTNHAYWNLAGSGTIDDHELWLNASRRLAFDAAFLPVSGPPITVADTAFDYTRGRAVGALDHFFLLDHPGDAATLRHPPSGRHMRIITNQSGVATYSGERLRATRAGLCIQASAWPDAPNRPDFPSARLDLNTEYLSLTTHVFTVADSPQSTLSAKAVQVSRHVR